MEKIAIVSRSFWPENPAIGEALLLLSESLAKNAKPLVVTLVAKDFPRRLKAAGRGQGVKFSTLLSLTNSSSHMLLRIAELLFFTGFVFISLCWHRPDKVYVATNPPIFTPLAVRWYCWLFSKKYLYHLQDIHPEATQVVTGTNSWVNRLLLNIDIKTILQAAGVITLTKQMQGYIVKRIGKDIPISLVANPSVQETVQDQVVEVNTSVRTQGFVYCGNAGRLQRIPLLVSAIEQYLAEGGELPFVFAGGGVYSQTIQELSERYSQVVYLGVLSGSDAAKLLSSYTIGLMPIEDEVTNYAFPSKSSSYIFSGCRVLAICGDETSVAVWIKENNLGYVVEPSLDSIVQLFHTVEKKQLAELKVSEELLKKLTPKAHAEKLEEIIIIV